MTASATTYGNAALATAELLPASQNRAPATQRKSTPDVSRRDVSLPQKTQKTAIYQPNLLSLLIGKFIASRQRAADREIARYLATTGGKMTDSIEREIQRRLI